METWQDNPPAARSRRRDRSQGETGLRRLQRATAAFVAALPLLAALPLASNRPVFWLGWTALLAFAGAAYGWLHGWLQPSARLRAGAQRPLLWLWAVFAGAALVQSAPLAAWLPPTLLSLPQPAAGVLPTPVSISVAPDASVLAALRLGGYAVLAFLVLQVAARPERARAVAWAVVLGVVAHAVLALALLRLGDDAGLWGIKTAYEGSATGGFVNRNAFASYLGLGFLLGLSLLLAPSDQAPSGPRVPLLARLRAGPVLAAGALVLIGLALLATQSRMGFAAAALGAVICVALSMDLRRGFLRGALPWTLAVLGLAGVALWVLGGATLERAVFLESAVEDRGLLYAQVREMIAARPWTGWGADAFEPSFMLHHRPPLTSDFDWEYAHSTYLANWVEFGLVAGSIPFVVFLVVAWRLVAALRAGQGDPALTVAGLSVLAMAAFHAVVDFSYEVPANAYLLVLVIALGLGRLGTPRPR